MNADLHGFQYGTWIPSLQIGNGIIQGQYTDRIGHWSRIGHQVFANAYFRLNYNESQVEEAVRRNTTVQEIRIGTLPYEANNGASVFDLVVSHNHFIQNNRLVGPQAWGHKVRAEVLSVGARSIWGSPRVRVFANERAITGNLNSVDRMPLATELFLQDLRPSTNGVFIEFRVSGTYTAFPDLRATDPVNTPPPIITEPSQPPPLENEWPPFAGVILRRGMQGESVRQVQERLNVLGASPQLNADGIFGPLTEGAVMAFQRRQGLNADGVVGPITWNALGGS